MTWLRHGDAQPCGPEAIRGFLEAAGATSPKGKTWETLRKG